MTPLVAGRTPGLAELARPYAGILSDVWGVVHNGIEPHWSAVEALVDFRARGGRVVLITNAPRPGHVIVAQLDAMGVPRTAYDGLVSSGDATLSLLEPYRGETLHRVGPAADAVLFDGLGIAFGPAETARAVVVTDLDDDDDTPADYAARMALWRERALPLICANPDKIVEEGSRLIYCGGALADAYEEIGGRVMMAGKPYTPIYIEAKALLDAAAGRTLEPAQILAIGDSLRTDAIGAAHFGIDLLFITGSIHAEELDAFNDPPARRIADFLSASHANMIGFMPRLAP